MSNTESTHAMKRYRVRTAKCLPGQILGVTSMIIHHHRSANSDSYLLPDPNTLSSGLNTRGSISPFLRNLSGLKASGSG